LQRLHAIAGEYKPKPKPIDTWMMMLQMSLSEGGFLMRLKLRDEPRRARSVNSSSSKTAVGIFCSSKEDRSTQKWFTPPQVGGGTGSKMCRCCGGASRKQRHRVFNHEEACATACTWTYFLYVLALAVYLAYVRAAGG